MEYRLIEKLKVAQEALNSGQSPADIVRELASRILFERTQSLILVTALLKACLAVEVERSIILSLLDLGIEIGQTLDPT